MITEELLAAIDQEIARLQNVRNLLAESAKTSRRRSRKRTLSASARAKIAEAQRKRWAASRKQAKKK